MEAQLQQNSLVRPQNSLTVFGPESGWVICTFSTSTITTSSQGTVQIADPGLCGLVQAEQTTALPSRTRHNHEVLAVYLNNCGWTDKTNGLYKKKARADSTCRGGSGLTEYRGHARGPFFFWLWCDIEHLLWTGVMWQQHLDRWQEETWQTG